jgi:hypothetical protein
MKFIIRDDDLNYFSKPALIGRWYVDIFVQNIPVGFATIPFVNPTSDVYTDFAVGEKEYPISENIELVTYVKGNHLMEILQHGSTHETKDGIYEYAKSQGLFEDTKRGKEELERAFEREIKVFVPPHDWISSHGVLAVEAVGMNIIRGRGMGLRNLIWRKQYFKNFLKMLVFRFPKYISVSPPVYPYILDFGKHKEMTSYRLEDPDIMMGLDYVHRKNGVFVVVTHLHGYTDEKKRLLLKLVEKARGYHAEFVRPSTIFS